MDAIAVGQLASLFCSKELKGFLAVTRYLGYEDPITIQKKFSDVSPSIASPGKIFLGMLPQDWDIADILKSLKHQL